MICHVLTDTRPTGWFGASLYALPWVSPNITKLSLTAAPYSITLSTKVDGLWSSVFYLYLFNCIYSGIRKRHLWMFPWAPCINCLNTCRIPTGSASGQRCHFVFHATFDSIYTSVFSFSPFYCRFRERELTAWRTLLPSSFFIRLLRPSLLPETVFLVSLLFFSLSIISLPFSR